MVTKAQILDYAEVVDKNGDFVGVVDHFESEDQIKLVKKAPNADGSHHLIPLAWVTSVDDNKVILSKTLQEVEQEWKAV